MSSGGSIGRLVSVMYGVDEDLLRFDFRYGSAIVSICSGIQGVQGLIRQDRENRVISGI